MSHEFDKSSSERKIDCGPVLTEFKNIHDNMPVVHDRSSYEKYRENMPIFKPDEKMKHVTDNMPVITVEPDGSLSCHKAK